MDFDSKAELPTRPADGADTAVDINFGHGGNPADRPRLLQTQQRQNAAGMNFSITIVCLCKSEKRFLKFLQDPKTCLIYVQGGAAVGGLTPGLG